MVEQVNTQNSKSDVPDDYVFMPVLGIGQEVQLNFHYERKFKPAQELLNAVFIIIEIEGNNIHLDKYIYEHENIINRYYIKPYKDSILKLHRTQRKLKPTPIKDFLVKEPIQQPIEENKNDIIEEILQPIIEEPKIIPSIITNKSARHINSNKEKIENIDTTPLHPLAAIIKEFEIELKEDINKPTDDFFTFNTDDIYNKYIDRINSLKVSNYEKRQTIEKIKKIIKTLVG